MCLIGEMLWESEKSDQMSKWMNEGQNTNDDVEAYPTLYLF